VERRWEREEEGEKDGDKGRGRGREKGKDGYMTEREGSRRQMIEMEENG